jgi:hypothetical protein
LAVATVATLGLCTFSTGHAKDANSYAALLIPPGFPEVTPQQKALTAVPFAPGAAAVVLVEDETQTQDPNFTSLRIVRIERFRRVKILTQAGVEAAADYRHTLIGDWRVSKVDAQTILPDGTVVAAKDSIFQDKTAGSKNDESAVRSIRVAFPKVQVGAILDLRESFVVDGAPFRRFSIQDRFPVIETHLMVVIPDGLQLKIGSFFMSAEEQKPITGRAPQGRYYAWRFANQSAIPDEPNQPPLADISKAVVIYPESFKTEAVYWPFAPDWKTWAKERKESWDEFLKKKHDAVAALAQQACEGRTTPIEKAEAVRLVVKDRFRINYEHVYPPVEASPDDLLAKGSGDSADAAGLAMAMLKSAGVAAVPVVYRNRDEGVLPKDTPVVNLLNDVLLRIATEKGPAYLSVSKDFPAGITPYDARGVWAMPIDGTAEGPFLLPDFAAPEFRIARVVQASLSTNGSIHGDVTATVSGLRAAQWRSRLRALSAEDRTSWVQSRLRSANGALVVTSVEFVDLESDSKDLLVRAAFAIEGYAVPAGKRLFVNLNLLQRELTGDWSSNERHTAVDLDGAYEDIDTVLLTLPPEAAEAVAPSPPASYDAGNVGRYTASYEKRGNVVVLNRAMRLNVYRFPASAYKDLRRWFGDIAAMDDKTVTVTLQ